MILERRPDVVLLDVHMPDGGGLEVLRRVHHVDARRSASSRCSVSDAAEDVIAIVRAGARGYVTKTISGADLIDADLPRRGRRRGLLAAPGRIRARRLRRVRPGAREPAATPSSTS